MYKNLMMAICVKMYCNREHNNIRAKRATLKYCNKH